MEVVHQKKVKNEVQDLQIVLGVDDSRELVKSLADLRSDVRLLNSRQIVVFVVTSVDKLNYRSDEEKVMAQFESDDERAKVIRKVAQSDVFDFVVEDELCVLFGDALRVIKAVVYLPIELFLSVHYYSIERRVCVC